MLQERLPCGTDGQHHAERTVQPQRGARTHLEACGLQRALTVRAAMQLQTHVRSLAGTAAIDLLPKGLAHRLVLSERSEREARAFLEENKLATALKLFDQLLPHAVYMSDPEEPALAEGEAESGVADGKKKRATRKKAQAKATSSATAAAAANAA